ncbi:sugar (and other) transporter family protein, partial [Vibrio parahaemolyticus V14/01]
MYVPSIGHMAGEFLVSASSLQAVMACYLIPYGLSQFAYGTLSDRLGRKPIIIVGLLIYILGTYMDSLGKSTKNKIKTSIDALLYTGFL